MHKKTSGFTMLELIIVIGIITVLAGLIYSAYLQQSKDASVKNAVSQLASDLNQARLLSQQQSKDASLTFNSNTSYTLKLPGLPDATKTLPIGTVANIYGSGTSAANTVITYSAPYAEIGTNVALLITRQETGAKQIRLGLAGLTGTVVTSNVN